MWFNELVLTFFLAHLFKGNICQHFAGVHVSGCACTTLVHVGQKLVMILSIYYILAGFLNGVKFFFAHSSHFVVSTGGSHLYHCISLYIIRIKICTYSTDLEIFQCTECLYSIICIKRNFFLTKQITFCTGFLSLYI